MTPFPYNGEISTIAGLDDFVDQLQLKLGKRYNFSATPTLYFRGHCNSDFQLLSKFNRDFISSGRKIEDISKAEQSLIQEFESILKSKNLYEHISTFSSLEKGYGGLWERIAQFQHAGLATRLLDWTNSWLVSLFFALYDPRQIHTKQSADFWIFDMTHFKLFHEEDLSAKSPFEVKCPFQYHSVNYLDENYQKQIGVCNKMNQGGHFFVQSHHDSFIPMEESQDLKAQLQRWQIMPENKEKIMNEILTKHATVYSGDVYDGFEILSEKYYVKTDWAEKIRKMAEDLNKNIFQIK
jgi:hypothetical protein